MNFEDILLVQDPAHALGTILGQTDAKSNKVISQNISDDAGPCNKNIAVFGAAGSGKTFSFALPFCDQALKRRESLVITDPRGEIFEKTADKFRDAGYVVRCLNFQDPTQSDGWDPFAAEYNDPDRTAVMASAIKGEIKDIISRLSFVQNMVSSEPAIDTTLPGKQPCVYYCILPHAGSSVTDIPALFVLLLLYDLVVYADSCPGFKCKVPVNFLLDGFAHIGKIPAFDKRLATVRSRGISFAITFDDLPQLRILYGNETPAIMSHCATFLGFDFHEPETAKFFSDQVGTASVAIRVEQLKKTRTQLMPLDHPSYDNRVTVTPDELMMLPTNKCFIIVQGVCAVDAYKHPYSGE
mgnify:FL=1